MQRSSAALRSRRRLELRTAPLWRALADPTRRRVLDLLLDRPRITGEIASHFQMSRIAVMRHLQVLTKAGLVVSRKQGRERRYYLNAIPLQQIYQRWFDPIAAGWASGMLRLQSRVEAEDAVIGTTRPSVDLALNVRLNAAPAVIFDALTTDPGAWWGHPMLRPQTRGLTLGHGLGGLFVEDWENGGAILAAVTKWARNQQLELTGPFHLGLGVGVANFELAADANGTLLQFSFQAFGPIDPDRARQFSEGWTELIARRLKAFIEEDRRLGISPGPEQRRKKPLKRRRNDG
jgi:DNA-binding transcriptional ArsR family regulator/uncharacterized protein YndB with AHSA1/START domain